jgi:hypothetical protein
MSVIPFFFYFFSSPHVTLTSSFFFFFFGLPFLANQTKFYIFIYFFGLQGWGYCPVCGSWRASNNSATPSNTILVDGGGGGGGAEYCSTTASPLGVHWDISLMGVHLKVKIVVAEICCDKSTLFAVRPCLRKLGFHCSSIISHAFLYHLRWVSFFKLAHGVATTLDL